MVLAIKSMPKIISEKPVTEPKSIEEVKPGEEKIYLEKKDILMEWKAPEYRYFGKNPVVYIGGGAIAVILLIYAIATLNWLFALIVIMLAVIVHIFMTRTPEVLDLAITKKGMKVGDRLYTWEDDLDTFWILYEPPDLKSLNFSRKNKLSPTMTLELMDQNPLKVRELLLEYLTEDIEKEEHPADRFARKIGF